MEQSRRHRSSLTLEDPDKEFHDLYVDGMI